MPCRSAVSHTRRHRVATLPAISRTSYAVSWRMLSCVVALLCAMSQPVLRYTQQPRHPPVTIPKLYHDTTGAKPRHTRATPLSRHKTCVTIQNPCRARWAVSRAWAGSIVSWLYRGRARPYHGRVLPSHVCLLRALCHDTVYCIVTQHKEKMGSSPFQPPLHLFLSFFHSFFFSFCSTYWKTTKIILFYFFQ